MRRLSELLARSRLHCSPALNATRQCARGRSSDVTTPTVPGAFPGYCYDGRKKSVGSSDYEQLRTNWSENLRFRHAELATPISLGELQEVVRTAGKVRAVGSAHSFNHLCDAPDATLLSLASMSAIDGIDPEAMTVSAEGGVTVGNLCRYLAPRGCALYSMCSFPHLTFVGGAATGSHGSGIRTQGFAVQISALDFVLPTGELRSYSRATHAAEELASAAVNLGCLGPVARLSIDICESYDVEQRCYTMPMAEYLANFHAMVDAHDSVSTFANFGDGVVEWTFQRDRVPAGAAGREPFAPPETIHGGAGVLRSGPCRIYESDVEHPGTGVFSWHDGMHFFMHGCFDDPMPYIGLQTEWYVPIEEAIPALEAAIAASKHWPGWGTSCIPGEAPVVVISELRQVAGDPAFLSPTPTDSLSIHFTFGHHPAEVMRCVEQLQDALAPFSARPHWGKLFTPAYMTKERVRQLYPQLPKFVDMCRSHDPGGKFRNNWLEQMMDFL